MSALTITNPIELDYATKVLEAFADQGYCNHVTDALLDAVNEYELLDADVAQLEKSIFETSDSGALIRVLSDQYTKLSTDHIIELANQLEKNGLFNDN